jgi:hypothetical protein
MKKRIIFIILSTGIRKIFSSNLSDNEIDFINYIFELAYDYLYDYIYDLFKHYIYPKIVRSLKRLIVMIKEYIIDIKSRLW